jgi:hypothetical protein
VLWPAAMSSTERSPSYQSDSVDAARPCMVVMRLSGCRGNGVTDTRAIWPCTVAESIGQVILSIDSCVLTRPAPAC